MQWKLRSSFFSGPGTQTVSHAGEALTILVDKDGYFDLAEHPKTFALGIFAKPVFEPRKTPWADAMAEIWHSFADIFSRR